MQRTSISKAPSSTLEHYAAKYLQFGRLVTQTPESGYFNPNPSVGRPATETPVSGYFNPNHGFGRPETETTGSGYKNA